MIVGLTNVAPFLLFLPWSQWEILKEDIRFMRASALILADSGGYNNPLWLYTYFSVSAHSICSLEVLGKTQQKFLTGAEEQCLH